MNKYLKEFEEHLDQFEADNWDDFDISAKDDEEPGYSETPMYDQLGKVLDSQGNPKPVDTVKTDDGKMFKVTGDQARVIRMLMTTDKVKPQVRTQFQKDMQQSSSAADFFDIKDYHQIPQLFVKRYLG